MSITLGLALTLASLGAQAFASGKGAMANKENMKYLEKRYGDLTNELNTVTNQDYLDRESSQNTIANYLRGIKDINKNIEGKAAMTGASEESKLASKESLNNAYGEFISNLSSQGDSWKLAKEGMLRQELGGLAGQIYGSKSARAGQWATAAGNAAQLASAGIAADNIPGEQNANVVIPDEIKSPPDARMVHVARTARNPKTYYDLFGVNSMDKLQTLRK